MTHPARTLCLLYVLSLACGRTGIVMNVHPDADQDEGRAQDDAWDVSSAPDSAAAPDGSDSVDAKASCALLSKGPVDWPVVELVVDGSASMAATASGIQTTWEVTREALKRVISSLTPASPAVGLTVFPNGADCTLGSVVVPASPITGQSQAVLLAALDGVVPGGGRSPTPALTLARADSSKTFPNGLALSPFKTLILLTSGGPDPSSVCPGLDQSAAALTTQVLSAYENGARTWVLALPGSTSSLDLLTEVARLGCGQSGASDAPLCFSNCDQGDSSGALIESSLNCILAGGTFSGNQCIPGMGDPSSVACTYPLTYLPANANRNDVTVSMSVGTDAPRLVPRTVCESDADGWNYSSDGEAIVFCGRACSDTAGAWKVSIAFGCTPE